MRFIGALLGSRAERGAASLQVADGRMPLGDDSVHEKRD